MAFQDWKIKSNNEMNGKTIRLIHLDDYKLVPEGTTLYDIFGDKFIKGIDSIDLDTRAGFIAYGPEVKD